LSQSPVSILPPVGLRRLVSNTDSEREYLEIGAAVASMLGHLGMLDEGARLLDVGCGCGRVAQHLLDSPLTEYVGFDRNPDLIAWAAAEIGARDRRFRFEHLPIVSPYDEVDGHAGEIAAAEVAFPAASGSLTAVLFSSVFTHLPVEVCRHYLAEAARVLAPRGRILSSWFVVEEGEADSYGLAYYYPRPLLESLFAAAGLEGRSLLDRPADRVDPRERAAQEFFLLEKP